MPQQNISAQVTDQHVYCFEVWPDPLPMASYPMLLASRTPRITASSGSAARKVAQARHCPAGYSIGAGQHIRAACTPCHPGRDVPVREETSPRAVPLSVHFYAGGSIASDDAIAAQYAAIWDAAGV